MTNLPSLNWLIGFKLKWSVIWAYWSHFISRILLRIPKTFKGLECVFLYREIEECHNFSTVISSLDPVCQQVPTSGRNWWVKREDYVGSDMQNSQDLREEGGQRNAYYYSLCQNSCPHCRWLALRIQYSMTLNNRKCGKHDYVFQIRRHFWKEETYIFGPVR